MCLKWKPNIIVVVVVVVLPSNVDSLKGRRGAMFQTPPTYTQDPTSQGRAASGTGGNCRFPPFLPMRDRAPRRFLGTRTKIHAADDPPLTFVYGS